MRINPNELVATLTVELDAFRQAAANRDRRAMVLHADTLSRLAAGVAEHLDPTPAPPKKESLVDFKEACVGRGSEPFTAAENAAAKEILTALAVGLNHWTSIRRFKDWVKHTPPEDLTGTVTEVRLRYFDQCPNCYLPKSTVETILRERKEATHALQIQ